MLLAKPFEQIPGVPSRDAHSSADGLLGDQVAFTPSALDDTLAPPGGIAGTPGRQAARAVIHNDRR